MTDFTDTGSAEGAGLTNAEQQFFATGDASVLGLATQPAPSEPEPEPQAAPAVPQPEAQPQPAAQSPLEQALEMQRARVSDLERQLDAQRAAATQPRVAAEEVPDPVTDPLGNMIYQLNRQNKQIEELQAKLTEREQQAAYKAEFESFTSNVRELKAEFAKANPDFDAAYTHIRQIRSDDLVALGHSKADINKMLLQDEIRLAQAALERGKNPAEEMYAMAKRYGYRPAADTQQQQREQKQQQAEQQVTRLANGQFAARAPQRAATTNDLTLEGLKDAGESDLNKVVLDDAMWKQIVGGKGGGDIFH